MSLKKAKTLSDFGKDRVVIFKRPVPIELSSSGYLLNAKAEEFCNKNDVLIVTVEIPTKRWKIQLKLHRQA